MDPIIDRNPLDELGQNDDEHDVDGSGTRASRAIHSYSVLNTSETIEFSGMNIIINNDPLDELNQIDNEHIDDQNETRGSRRIHNFSLNE